MKTALPDTNSPNIEPLLQEIERYLSAVELFRAEGCEPRWADDWFVRQLAESFGGLVNSRDTDAATKLP